MPAMRMSEGTGNRIQWSGKNYPDRVLYVLP
jgi:hypothetical protein